MNCEDIYINVTDVETLNITSPGYPQTPRSKLAYHCSWHIIISEESALFVEIKHFEASDWLVFNLITPLTGDVRLRLSSDLTPRSITIANQQVIFVELLEDIAQPKRSHRELFLAEFIIMDPTEESKCSN